MNYLIWSDEYNLYWRPKGHGYTTNIKDAGIFDDDFIQSIIAGDKKRLKFIPTDKERRRRRRRWRVK